MEFSSELTAIMELAAEFFLSLSRLEVTESAAIESARTLADWTRIRYWHIRLEWNAFYPIR